VANGRSNDGSGAGMWGGVGKAGIIEAGEGGGGVEIGVRNWWLGVGGL